MIKVDNIEVECPHCGYEHEMPADNLPVLHCAVYSCSNCERPFDVSVDRAYSVLANYVLEVVGVL